MKITFVCLGNICRSPMAEFIFKDIVEKNNMSSCFDITSAGTAGYHDGDDMHHGTKTLLQSKKIKCNNFVSKKLTKQLFDDSNIILVMDDNNFNDVVNSFGQNPKIKKMTDYCSNKDIKYVPDPWFTKNFDEVFEILNDSLNNFFNQIKK